MQPKPKRTFDQWMAAMDAILIRKFGLTSADLPDICYRDMYDDGESPAAAARQALEELTM